jgi:hypothetical protein
MLMERARQDNVIHLKLVVNVQKEFVKIVQILVNVLFKADAIVAVFVSVTLVSQEITASKLTHALENRMDLIVLDLIVLYAKTNIKLVLIKDALFPVSIISVVAVPIVVRPL